MNSQSFDRREKCGEPIGDCTKIETISEHIYRSYLEFKCWSVSLTHQRSEGQAWCSNAGVNCVSRYLASSSWWVVSICLMGSDGQQVDDFPKTLAPQWRHLPAQPRLSAGDYFWLRNLHFLRSCTFIDDKTTEMSWHEASSHSSHTSFTSFTYIWMTSRLKKGLTDGSSPSLNTTKVISTSQYEKL